MAKFSTATRPATAALHDGRPGRRPGVRMSLGRMARRLGTAALAGALSAAVSAGNPSIEAPSEAAAEPAPRPPRSAADPAPAPAVPRAVDPVPVPPPAHWMTVPRITGRLTRRDIGLVINTADPYSVAVGAHYVRARRLSPRQVLRIDLPLVTTLTESDFERLKSAVDHRFGAQVQALALAWSQPYAVACQSITGALALGFDRSMCEHTCAPSAPSPYFNQPTLRPFADLGVRPAMLLAARDVDGARRLIDRGVASDGTLGLRGAPPVQVHYVATADRARNVRAPLFPPAGPVPSVGIEVHVDSGASIGDARRVLLYETGLSRVPDLDRVQFVPGALADHLTSFGGRLDGSGGQMPVLDWIAAGATASYGSVSEPCAHLQKFPHPQALLLYYVQGSTAIEAYWRSVAWPRQGLFVGEPLAAPFARRGAGEGP